MGTLNHLKKRTLQGAIFILLLILAVQITLAQSQCRFAVQDALSLVGDVCGDTQLNQLCYGNYDVEAQFFTSSISSFANPSDIVPLNVVARVQTTPYDLQTNSWGIALMKVQADLPNTIPGQAVTFILMGDMNMSNDVTPQDIITYDETVMVETRFASNLRIGPGEDYFIAEAVPPHTRLEAYMLDASRTWVHVIMNNRPRWIHRDTLQVNASIDALPAGSGRFRTPMRSFFLQPGLGSATCAEAPDTLLIQSPDHLETELILNGQEMRIGSSIVVEIDQQKNMIVSVLDGYASIGNINLPTGYRVQVPLNDEGELSGIWNSFRPMTDGEIQRYGFYTEIPDQLLSYPVELPDEADIAASVKTMETLAEPQNRDNPLANDPENTSNAVNPFGNQNPNSPGSAIGTEGTNPGLGSIGGQGNNPNDNPGEQGNNPNSPGEPGNHPDSVKVTICHYPPGRPENAITIMIDIVDLDNHLAHGDTEGACPQ